MHSHISPCSSRRFVALVPRICIFLTLVQRSQSPYWQLTQSIPPLCRASDPTKESASAKCCAEKGKTPPVVEKTEEVCLETSLVIDPHRLVIAGQAGVHPVFPHSNSSMALVGVHLVCITVYLLCIGRPTFRKPSPCCAGNEKH